MSKIYRIVSSTALFLILGITAQAQDATDVLRYSLRYPSFDGKTMVLPGVAYASGLGSVQQNPASLALFDESFYTFGLSGRSVNEETGFMGTLNDFRDTQINVGQFGLLYRVPTLQGSMVVGATYNQTTDFNRAMGFSVRNNRSTLTDFYNITEDDDLYFAAFDVYALDYADVDSTFTESIFRIGFTPEEYPGIDQDVEMTERGKMNELNAFFATEFQRNLMFGASLGITTGSYSYRRTFLETDSQNDYEGTLIDSDGDGEGDTDIHSVLSNDRIDAEFYSFTARLGMVYRIIPPLSLGVSYQFPQRLFFDEDYNTSISSIFDNGGGFGPEEVPGRFSYQIALPSRVHAGLSLQAENLFVVSASAERVDYGSARIDFGDQDLAAQNDENRFIRAEFKEVYNLQGGIELRMNEYFRPRFGYARHPSPIRSFDQTREFYSGGFTAALTPDVEFDLGVQYSTWKDRSNLYFYDDGVDFVNETTDQNVTRWHVMGGIKVKF